MSLCSLYGEEDHSSQGKPSESTPRIQKTPGEAISLVLVLQVLLHYIGGLPYQLIIIQITLFPFKI